MCRIENQTYHVLQQELQNLEHLMGFARCLVALLSVIMGILFFTLASRHHVVVAVVVPCVRVLLPGLSELTCKQSGFTSKSTVLVKGLETNHHHPLGPW